MAIRKRRKGASGNDPSKGRNPAAAGGKGRSRQQPQSNKGNPPRRTQAGATNSPSSSNETPAERIQRLRNTGVVSHASSQERKIFESKRTPSMINSQPQQTPAEVRALIDDASSNLSPATAQALRRAEWYGDDAQLLTYRPTHTSDNTRPRTLAAGYDYHSQTLFVRFRGARTSPTTFADGVGYEYYGVTYEEWQLFRDNWSPGRYINAVLDTKAYTPATW